MRVFVLLSVSYVEGYCAAWGECGLDSVSRIMLVEVWGQEVVCLEQCCRQLTNSTPDALKQEDWWSEDQLGGFLWFRAEEVSV